MSGTYLSALQLKKKLEEKAKEASRNRELAEEKLKEAEDRLAEAKKIEAEIGGSEDKLKKAKNAMESKDFKACMDLCEEAIDTVSSGIKKRVGSVFESAEELIKLSKSLGGEPRKAEEKMNKAKDAAENYKFVDAIDLAKEAWEETEKTLHEKVSKVFSTTQAMIIEAETNTSPEAMENAKDLIKSAREFIDRGELSEAFNLIQQAKEVAQSKLDTFASRMLEEVQQSVQLGEELEIDMSEARTLLEEGYKGIEKNDYKLATEKAMAIRETAEKTIKEFVEQKFQQVQEKYQEAKDMGANVEDAELLFEDVTKAIDERLFKAALDDLKKCEEEISNNQFQVVLKHISQSRSKFITAKNIGADITKAVELLNQARASLKDNNYLEALKFAQQSDDAVEALVKTYEDAVEEIKNIENSFSVAEEIGVETSKPKEILDEARNALEDMDFQKALELVNESKKVTESTESEKVMDSIEASEFILTLCERINIDISELNKNLEDAISTLRSKDYKGALEKALDVRKEAENKAEEKITTIITRTASLTPEDNAEAQQKLQQARDLLTNKEYDQALQIANSISKSVVEQMEQDISESIKQAESEIAIAESMGADVALPIELVNKSRLGMTEDEYEEAKDFATKAWQEAKKSQQTIVNVTFTSAKDTAVKLKNQGFDVRHITLLLKRAKKAFDSKDYKGALEHSSEANQEGEALVAEFNKAKNGLAEMAERIKKAEEERVSVKDAQKLLAEANTLFDKGKFKETAEYIDKINAEVDKRTDQYTAAKLIISANELIKIAKEIGADSAEAEDMLATVKKAMKRKEYHESLENAKLCMEKLEEVVSSRIAGEISSSENIISEAMDIGVKTDKALEHLDEAKALLDKKEYTKSYEGVIACKKEMDEIKAISKKAAATIQSAQEKISDAENIHATVKDAKDQIKSAIESLKSMITKRPWRLPISPWKRP